MRTRLDEGLNPFESEPRYAPYILAALGDRTEAARRAVALGTVDKVLSGYAYPEGWQSDTARVRWNELCPDFDVEVLKAGAEGESPLLAELRAAEAPCAPSAPL